MIDILSTGDDGIFLASSTGKGEFTAESLSYSAENGAIRLDSFWDDGTAGNNNV